MTILEKIKENAAACPDRPMIITGRNNDESLTWRQIDEYSDNLAAHIKATAKTDTPVVVYGHKNPYMPVCFLACVKTGRAYCPVDINVPLSRVKAIIDSVDPDIILAAEPLDIEDDRICGPDDIKKISQCSAASADRSCWIGPEEVFYIIFTSGSTGTPKGVQITRDCLDNFIKWALTLGTGYEEGKEYVFINQAPFSFDLSVMDLYLCLYLGGTLWCLTKELQADPAAMYESLGRSGAHTWVSTPSFADVCLADPVFSGELMPELRNFLFCGEVLTNRTVKRLSERFPEAVIMNTYGPTESTCAVTSVKITPEMNEKISPLPVGAAKEGTWLRIIDGDGKEAENGEHGELVIIGDSVSTGYWKNAERSSAAFGTAFVEGREYRSYRTGDEAYLLDGMLYYCGRMDLQVKLHGYRIELEDIESNLVQLPGVEQAVVIPKYRDGKVSGLVGAVVSSVEIADKTAEAKAVREKLRSSLPEYMIPKKIVFVDSLPRTNNGKVDRKAVAGMI